MAEDLDRVQREVALAASTVSERALERESEDRSLIARLVIWLFMAAMLVVMAILALAGILSRDWRQIAAAATDLLKSVVLPVVTLVLGYYFGRSAKS